MFRATVCSLLALVALPFGGASPWVAPNARANISMAAAMTVSAAAPAAASRWDWPVADPHPIVRPYIAPDNPYSAGHRGIDIGVGVGVGSNDVGATDVGALSSGAAAVVRAPAEGIVHFAGIVVDRPVLSIRHPGGLISSYEPVTSPLTRGDVVTRGQEVGEVQAGHCVLPCLHFGVRLDGDYVSPLNYLRGTPRAILLPTRDP